MQPIKPLLATGADALLRAGVLGVGLGLWVANPMAAAVFAGVGGNLVSELLSRGLQQTCDRLTADTSLINHDLQLAIERAYNRAVSCLDRLWWETPRGHQIKRQDHEMRTQCQAVFLHLRQDAEQFLRAGEITELTASPDALRLLGSGQLRHNEALNTYLDSILFGHDPQLTTFVRSNLEPQLAAHFADELKTDNPKSNRAWRAYQRLMFDALLLGVMNLTSNQDALFRRLDAWDQRLQEITEDQRERTGEPGLQLVVDAAAAQIIESLANQFATTQRETKGWFDETWRLLHEEFEQTRQETRTLGLALAQGLEELQQQFEHLSGFSSVALELERARELLDQGWDSHAFFRGSKARWTDILAQHDAPRRITSQVVDFVERHAINPAGVPVALVHAPSGDGKTTVAMRAAADLATQGFNVAWLDAAVRDLTWKRLAEQSRTTPIVVFIDDAQRFEADEIEAFFNGLYQVNAKVVVVLFARRDIWFGIDVLLESVSSIEEFPFDKLDDQEIVGILEKMEFEDELGQLELISKQERIERFKEKSDRQLFVALLETQASNAFQEIIKRDVRDIRERFGEQIANACYIVSALHTFEAECSAAILEGLVGVQSLSADVLAKTTGLLVSPQPGPFGVQMRHTAVATTIFRLDAGRYDRIRRYILAASAAGSYRVTALAAPAQESSAIVQLLRNLRLQVPTLELKENEVRNLFAIASNALDSPAPVLIEWGNFERNRNAPMAQQLFLQATDAEPRNANGWIAWSAMERELGNIPEARRLFEKATEVAPLDERIWSRWAVMERDRGEIAEARRLFEKATEVAPLNVHRWLGWARLERERGDIGEARRLFRKATDVAPFSEDVWLAWANMERDRGEISEARRLFEKATEVAPQSSFGWLGWALLERHDINEARRLFRQATELAPHDVNGWFGWARLEKDWGDIRDARRLYHQATEVAPSDVDGWLAWARLEKERGQLPEARRLYGRATEAAPCDVQGWLGWAKLEREQENIPEARRLYEKATEAAPRDIQGWLGWAKLEREQENTPEARRLYEKVTESAPLNVHGWLGWAKLEAEQENIPEARRLYEKAVQVCPRDHSAWLGWALFEKEWGDDAAEVRRLFTKAIEVNPRNLHAWHAWGVFEKEQGNIPRARELFQKAIDVKPQNSHAWQAWGVLEKEEGNIPTAREMFQKAIDTGRRNSHAWQAWGVLEKEQGNIPRARELLRKAIELDPGNVLAVQALEILEAEVANLP